MKGQEEEADRRMNEWMDGRTDGGARRAGDRGMLHIGIDPQGGSSKKE